MPDSSATKILIVEDERDLATLLQDYLNAAQFSTEILADGNLVEPWLAEQHTDLILLDLMLPGKDGLDLCRAIRANPDTKHIPIIMVTARVEEIDRLLGLELGADDYVCKPYSPREIVARTKAVLRRIAPTQADINNSVQVTLLENSQQITLANKTIDLTTIEFALFKLLFQEPGRIFSRHFIMDNIYSDYRVVSDRTVDSHIKKLRKKLQETAPAFELIHSVYGAGYKYDPDQVSK
ncbi:response regulator [Teredinibacter waterburyi]|jgi:Response regulators consisting of a CheY-like receiver domain and a winged-helix DNA-binding domain|uniref:response regulator n=1 Tax=Teredinibacter waterburyi TaxID=1500538 RepID=UPI00165EC7A5|nr:response regulator [Teredinibacter waterburyi]